MARECAQAAFQGCEHGVGVFRRPAQLSCPRNNHALLGDINVQLVNVPVGLEKVMPLASFVHFKRTRPHCSQRSQHSRNPAPAHRHSARYFSGPARRAADGSIRERARTRRHRSSTPAIAGIGGGIACPRCAAADTMSAHRWTCSALRHKGFQRRSTRNAMRIPRPYPCFTRLRWLMFAITPNSCRAKNTG